MKKPKGFLSQFFLTSLIDSFFDCSSAALYWERIRIDHYRSSLADKAAAKNEAQEAIQKFRIETIFISDRGINFAFFNKERCILPSRIVRDVIHKDIATPLLVNGGMKAFEIGSIL